MNLNKHLLQLGVKQRLCVNQVRFARWIKPWNIGPEGEWKRARSRKLIRIELPDFNEMRLDDKLRPEEVRTRLKEKGIVPPRAYNERAIHLTCTNGILDPFVAPEGDGKLSIVTGSGAKQRFDVLTKKGRSLLALRKIRTFEDELDIPTFAEHALDVYIKAHKALAAKEYDLLHDYVTEYAFPEMTFKTDLKTIKWQFISMIEKPTVAHIRTLDVLTRNNVFAQMTVRLHSRQILAIYDRFGHLMHGSDAIVKDVLEYVVFEKHLANLYGKWRIHSKVSPDWMPPKEPIRHTFLSPPKPPPKSEEEIRFEKDGLISDQKKEEEKGKNKTDEKGESSTPKPALA